MAGSAAAVLLAAGSARAAEQDARTVAITVDDSGFQRGIVPANSGEQVRLVLTPTAGSVMVTVRSAPREIGYALQPLGELGRAATLDDKAEIAAGNSGGRG
jgi:hypothetical protein